MEKKVYFLSDIHLGIDVKSCPNRERDLIHFLEQITPKAEKLFLVGDVFDFWVEYDYAIRPDLFNILYTLRSMVLQGVEIHYIAGNHDFALGTFLHDTIGITVHQDPIDVTIQGKRLYLVHGDGVLPHDHAYRFLRTILRNPLCQKIYKLLHPNIGIPLAHKFSGTSRHIRKSYISEMRQREYFSTFYKILHKKKYDAVVFGHTHTAIIRHFNNKTYCNIGEWMKTYSYVTLESGVLQLWRYSPTEGSIEIEPQ